MPPESTSTKPMSKIAASSKLTRAAWRTLMLNKELFIVSLLSLAVSLVLLTTLVLVFVFSSGLILTDNSVEFSLPGDLINYAILAMYLFISYAIANYFSGAIAYAALIKFRGQDPTLKKALYAATKKAGPLLAFSGLQATVGLILNILSDRLPFAGKIATLIAGAAWSVATMFALPVIMDNKETKPLETVRHSSRIFTKIWGESVFIGLGLGIISVGVSIIMFVVLFSGVALSVIYSNWAFGVISFVLFLAGLMFYSLVLTTLTTIVKTAAYYYASTNQLPTGFDEELIRNVFKPKKAWLK